MLPGSAVPPSEHATPPAAVPSMPKIKIGNSRRFVFMSCAFELQPQETSKTAQQNALRAERIRAIPLYGRRGSWTQRPAAREIEQRGRVGAERMR